MPSLDAEELLHLAMQASQKGESDKAIVYLKESISQKPTAESLYILGAEYAEIGMPERAISHINEALKINPELHTARFQCGLLYFILNDTTSAINTWAQLSELGDHYLHLFATGLSLISSEKYHEAKEKIQQGISSNDENPFLNEDMNRIIANLNGESSTSNNSNSPETEKLIKNYSSIQ